MQRALTLWKKQQSRWRLYFSFVTTLHEKSNSCHRISGFTAMVLPNDGNKKDTCFWDPDQMRPILHCCWGNPPRWHEFGAKGHYLSLETVNFAKLSSSWSVAQSNDHVGLIYHTSSITDKQTFGAQIGWLILFIEKHKILFAWVWLQSLCWICDICPHWYLCWEQIVKWFHCS